MSAIDPLSLPLKPLIAPQAVDWWPPALGWWLILLSLLLIAFGIYYLYAIKKRYLKTTVQKAIKAHFLDYLKHKQKDKFVQALSYTLRQATLQRFPDVAGSIGNDWLLVLEKHLKDKPFTEGDGKWLALAPYLPPDQCAAIPVESLYELCLRWAGTL